MKYFLLLLLSALVVSCSGSKQVEFESLNQAECRNEMQITNENQFLGETVENLMVYQQGNLIFASMDVRTRCNAKITFDMEQNEDTIRLKLRNVASKNDDCICITNVTTSFRNLEPGTYKVMITNAAGNQLLAEAQASIN